MLPDLAHPSESVLSESPRSTCEKSNSCIDENILWDNSISDILQGNKLGTLRYYGATLLTLCMLAPTPA